MFPSLDENKPIWMHAEEREECKVRLGTVRAVIGWTAVGLHPS